MRDAFLWPPGRDVLQARRELYKQDVFMAGVEDLVGNHAAWAPIVGETKRTEAERKLAMWLTDQNLHADVVDRVFGMATARLLLADFPAEVGGPATRVITTAKRIVYLVDRTADLVAAAATTWGANDLLSELTPDLPSMLFVTNSVTSQGRAIAGDPFTGQLAAYIKIFATDIDNWRTHNVLVYYPHQLYSQLFTASGALRASKGVRLLGRGVDQLVFGGGVVVRPSDWRVQP